MTRILPQGTDTLNNPSHSFQHRVVSVDTSSPQSSIDIDSVGNVTIAASVITPSFVGGSAAGSKITYKSTTGTGTAAGIAHQWVGGTNGGTVIATMLNNGNVGIGTAAPTGLLDVYGGGIGTTFNLRSADVAHGMTTYAPTDAYGTFSNSVANDGGLTVRGFVDTNTSPGLNLGGFSVGDITAAYSANIIFQAAKANATALQAVGATGKILTLLNYDTEVLTVLGNGNVGIGTVAPTSLLDVNAPSTATTVYNNSAQSITRLNSDVFAVTNWGNDTTNIASIYLGAKANGASVVRISSVTGGSDLSSLAFQLRSTADTTITTEVMRIVSNGNVGIGTTAPTSPLHVGGAAGVNGGIKLELKTEGTSNISYIPIDFTVPTTGLVGQFLASASNYSSAANNLPANSVALLAEATSGTLWLGAGGSSGDIRFNTGGYSIANERMRITSAGNVGIGTTNPTAPLEVIGDFKNGYFFTGSSGGRVNIRGVSGVNGAYFSVGTVGTEYWGMYDTSTGSGSPAYFRSTPQIITGSTGGFNFGTNTTSATVDSGFSRGAANKIYVGNGTAGDYTGTLIAGNVGISTTSPTNILSLGGNAARIFWMERHTTSNTAGNTLTITAGGATAAATDKSGGSLILQGGLSTGTGESGVTIKGCIAGGSGTTDGTQSTGMQVLGNKIGFYGVTPLARAVLATGVVHTVDDVITALQNLGLVSQA